MSTQPNLNFDAPDVCRNRHKGNAQSEAANLRVEPHKATTRSKVFDYVRAQGSSGATLKEICRAFGKFPNELSGRLSELKKDGALKSSGEVREGCAVLIANESE